MVGEAGVFFRILEMITMEGYPKDQLQEKEDGFIYCWKLFSPSGNSYNSARDFAEGRYRLIAESNTDSHNEYDTYFCRFHSSILLFVLKAFLG